MNIKTVIKILTLVAPLAGVNADQIKIVLAILNILAEDTAEATKE
jgi:hypothetical protein